MKKSNLLSILFLLVLGLIARFYLVSFLENQNKIIVFSAIILIFGIGVFLIQKTAKIIEETTGILKNRTGIAGGLLQSLGTAFPDMIIGIVSAILSLQAASTNPLKAINLAIIAASTTFGSNIYNVFHAVWCIYRQNLASKLNKSILMFPLLPKAGRLIPVGQHKTKPLENEITNASSILTILALLTTIVALGMVLFGRVNAAPLGFKGDLYQLTRLVGLVVVLSGIWTLYYYRHGHSSEAEEDNKYRSASNVKIFFDLILSGIIILLAAEAIINSIIVFSTITNTPVMISGIFTALVGCLGEMIVVHDFSVNPRGRITDAVIGVAMDNIVTTIGAAFIAVMGGIFLGSDALIVIFVLILFGKSLLIHQLSILKDSVR